MYVAKLRNEVACVDHLTRLQLQQETLQACWEEVNRARQFRDCA
jgi:hypothetical protein